MNNEAFSFAAFSFAAFGIAAFGFAATAIYNYRIRTNTEQ